MRTLPAASHLRSTTIGTNERLIWVLYALIVVVFSLTAAALLWNRYQSTVAVAQERLTNLTLIHDENLLLQMRNIEAITRATVEETRTHSDDMAYVQSFVDLVAQRLPQLRTLLVISADGVPVADSRPERPALGMNTADRAYFTAHTQDPNAALFVDDPVQSRVDGDWSLPMSLGVWDENGVFAGIVIASLDPIYLSSVIGAFADAGIEGFIINENGIVLTSLPYDVDQIGMVLTNVDLPDETVPVATVASGTTLVAQRSVQPYGLRVVFRQNRANVVGPFLREATLTLVILFAMSAASFGILTQHLRQTRRIQQSETELRTLTDSISDFVVRIDRDLRHLYVNPALLKATGLSLEDYLGKTNREIGLPAEQVAMWEREMRRVFDTQTNHEIEFHYDTVDGDRVFQARLTPEFDAEGEVTAVVSVVRDITDLNQAQQKLAEQTQTLQLSLQAVEAGVWVWHVETNDVTWDAAIEAIHGLEPGTFGGTFDHWRERVHPDDLAEAERSLHASVESRVPWRHEFRIVRPDGSVRHVLAQALVVTETDSPARMIGVNVDVTDRVEAEAQRRKAERAQIEMEEQRKVIELKERFIAIASHDFRTPLTVIQSSAGLLARAADRYTSEQRSAKLGQIQEQVDYMTRLLDDVLVISQSNAKSLVLNPSRFALREFCDDLWADIVTLDNGAHLKDFAYDSAVTELEADRDLLRQAIENLLANAIKYTPAGKLVRFEICDEAEWVVFTITDEGYGIPEADQAHLFEPFHRARNVSNIQGTGLGLTIARDFIVLHGGSIDVTSREGNGTTFTVRLPAQGNAMP